MFSSWIIGHVSFFLFQPTWCCKSIWWKHGYMLCLSMLVFLSHFTGFSVAPFPLCFCSTQMEPILCSLIQLWNFQMNSHNVLPCGAHCELHYWSPEVSSICMFLHAHTSCVLNDEHERLLLGFTSQLLFVISVVLFYTWDTVIQLTWANLDELLLVFREDENDFLVQLCKASGKLLRVSTYLESDGQYFYFV